MKLELLEDLYTQALAELQDGEKQLLKLIPKMAKAVSTEELRTLFQQHTEETKNQARRLEELLGRRAKGKPKKAKAMTGLLAEAKELLSQEEMDPQLLDAALTAASQKVEAFEITCYACAHNYARLLGFHEDLKPLEESFHEEEKMEEKLSAISESLAMEELESETEGEPVQARNE
ncbi:MAG TPA: DUF892 family protein [Candidatus Sulfotelmatobacter sp.]|nr:DUF892 family protein [Candidatus Sulfotelmatobacter sp.]